MESYKGRQLADVIGSAGSMVLFMIFSVCMLIIISSAASAYERISSNYSETFNSSAAVRYISNKIRSSDKCELSEDGGVILYSGDVVCRIWCEEGGIFEKTASLRIPDTDGGDRIFSADSISVSDDGELYRISVSSGGESFEALLGRG